jgi:glycosyltransferase involved in cell wall biosynthesis
MATKYKPRTDAQAMDLATRTPRIAIAWKGLPAYGARLIRAALDVMTEPVVVLGTRAAVPVEGIEEQVSQPVVWLNDADAYSWTSLGLEAPQLFFQTSWATPAFNSLTLATKRAGGRVVCLHDNRLKRNLRQLLGAAYYRMALARRYDAAWAPGSSGRQFCRLLGIPNDDIYEGLYSGWTEVFQPGPPLNERPKRILFVGQSNERKGVDVLVEAWQAFHADYPEWELHSYGQGPLQHLLASTPGITAHPFLQSREVAAAMRGARFVVMPSLDDHWPLTIHEAASSGCGLLLSENVGNRHDLASDANAVIFPCGNARALEGALRAASDKDLEWLRHASAESVRLASAFSPTRFGEVFKQICARYLPAR